jgi:hypothetical protein
VATAAAGLVAVFDGLEGADVVALEGGFDLGFEDCFSLLILRHF